MNRIDKRFEKFSIKCFKLSKIFVKFTIYVVLLFLICGVFFRFGYRLFYEHSVDSENVKTIQYTLTGNKTVDDIANDLVVNNIIDDAIAFKFRAYIYKINFNPGVYSLNSGMTIKNILDIFDDAEKIDIIIETTSELTEDDLLNSIICEDDNEW